MAVHYSLAGKCERIFKLVVRRSLFMELFLVNFNHRIE